MMENRNKSIVLAMVVLLVAGCSMKDSSIFQPTPLDGMEQVPASAQSDALDAEVTAFLREGYTITAAQHYRVTDGVPWIAISKSVNNQMAERSIPQMMPTWYEPGIDFVELYPQGDGAFAVAMPKAAAPDAVELVGFYVLRRSTATGD